MDLNLHLRAICGKYDNLFLGFANNTQQLAKGTKAILGKGAMDLAILVYQKQESVTKQPNECLL